MGSIERWYADCTLPLALFVFLNLALQSIAQMRLIFNGRSSPASLLYVAEPDKATDVHGTVLEFWLRSANAYEYGLTMLDRSTVCGPLVWSSEHAANVLSTEYDPFAAIAPYVDINVDHKFVISLTDMSLALTGELITDVLVALLLVVSDTPRSLQFWRHVGEAFGLILVLVHVSQNGP